MTNNNSTTDLKCVLLSPTTLLNEKKNDNNQKENNYHEQQPMMKRKGPGRPTKQDVMDRTVAKIEKQQDIPLIKKRLKTMHHINFGK